MWCHHGFSSLQKTDVDVDLAVVNVNVDVDLISSSSGSHKFNTSPKYVVDSTTETWVISINFLNPISFTYISLSLTIVLACGFDNIKDGITHQLVELFLRQRTGAMRWEG